MDLSRPTLGPANTLLLDSPAALTDCSQRSKSAAA